MQRRKKYDQDTVDRVHHLRRQGKLYREIAQTMGWGNNLSPVEYILHRRKPVRSIFRKMMDLFF